MSYADVYRRSIEDPNGFWLDQAAAIDWDKAPEQALFEGRAPIYEWFKDAEVNTCWNAVDRHVAQGRGNQNAIIYDSPISHTKQVITYAELLERVSSLAGALKAKGVTKGDRVIIYMPMIPQALEAMLACARLGAVHSVVFGGFAARELATRIDDATPKAIIAASCGLEPGRVVHYKPLLDGAINMATHKPDFTVIYQREQEVAKLVGYRLRVSGGNGGRHLIEFLVDLTPNVGRRLPVQAHCGRFLAQSLGAQKRGQGAGDSVESAYGLGYLLTAFGALLGFLLAFDRFDTSPIALHLCRIRDVNIAEDVRVPADELIVKPRDDVGDVEGPALGCQFGVEDHLQQEITELVFQIIVHTGVQCFQNLVAFFD